METEQKSPITITSSKIVSPIISTDDGDGARDYEPLKQEGQLIFDQNDVKESCSLLDHLLRSLFYTTHVTDAYFNARHRQYAMDLNLEPADATNKKNNLMKALRKGNITFTRFVEAIVNVLHLCIKDLQWLVTDEKGVEHIIDLQHGYVTREEKERMDREQAERQQNQAPPEPAVSLKPQEIDLDVLDNIP